MTTFEISMSIISTLAAIGVFSSLYKIGHTVGSTSESINHTIERLDNMDKKFDNIDKKFDNIDKKFNDIDKKFNDIDKKFDNIDKKFNDMDKKFNDMDKRFNDMDKRFDIIDKKIDKLPCENHNWKIQILHDEVMDIKNLLTSKPKKIDFFWENKHSPIMLNENGLKLYEAIKGEEFLTANNDFFLEKIAAKNPKTPLDVELTAKEVLIGNSDNDIYNDLKNWIYFSPAMQITDENGETRKHIVTLLDVCFVLGIALRDTYLSLHPELLPDPEKYL